MHGWSDVFLFTLAWPGMILTVYIIARVISYAIIKSKEQWRIKNERSKR
jgi:hypothetical protein